MTHHHVLAAIIATLAVTIFLGWVYACLFWRNVRWFDLLMNWLIFPAIAALMVGSMWYASYAFLTGQ